VLGIELLCSQSNLLDVIREGIIQKIVWEGGGCSFRA
jgi:hypothetical protein